MSNHRLVTFRGKEERVTDLCERFGVKPATAAYRLKQGWTPEQTFETPLIRGRKPMAGIETIRSKGETNPPEREADAPVEAPTQSPPDRWRAARGVLRPRSAGNAQFAAGFAAGAAAFLAAALEQAAAVDKFPQVMLSRKGVEQVLRMVSIEEIVARQFGGGA